MATECLADESIVNVIGLTVRFTRRDRFSLQRVNPPSVGVQANNGSTNLKSRVKLSFRIWTEEGDDSASERQSMSVTIVFALTS
jgi:hypothetical protein